MSGDWGVALDLFESGLAGYRRLLAEDDAATPPMWPPAELIGVPIPDDQVDRARRLLAEARELEGRLQAKRAALPAARSGGPNRRVTPQASFLTDL